MQTFSNFGELQFAVGASSPCFMEQLTSRFPKEFELCETEDDMGAWVEEVDRAGPECEHDV
jgi:hypothetical protein